MDAYNIGDQVTKGICLNRAMSNNENSLRENCQIMKIRYKKDASVHLYQLLPNFVDSEHVISHYFVLILRLKYAPPLDDHLAIWGYIFLEFGVGELNNILN